MRRAMAVVMMTALAVSAAACGAGPGRTSAATSTPTAAGLRRAVVARVTAISDLDADRAFAIQSARCRAVEPQAAWAAALGRPEARHYDLLDDPIIRSAEVAGTEGTVVVALTDDADAPTTQQAWVVEDGQWRYDGCSAAAAPLP